MKRIHPLHSLRITRQALIGLGVLACLSLFAATLAGKSSFAFRDVAHFYNPLAQFLQPSEQQNLIPLWSTQDSFGIPLAGETTTAIFYPLRILFFTLFSPDIAIAAYVVAHLLWAGLGVYRLAFHVTKHSAVSCIGAFSYATAGPVFFLYTNPPFLVGAAWLPWTFLYLIKSNQTYALNAPHYIVLAAASIAMSILGGDPQTTVHAIMAWCLWRFCVLVFASGSSRLRATPNDSSHPLPKNEDQVNQTGNSNQTGHSDSRKTTATLRKRNKLVQRFQISWLKLPATLLLAVCLSMPQIAAGLSWSSQSHRSATAPAHIGNLFGWPKRSVRPPRIQNDTDTFPVLRHSDRVLEFSVAPWHMVEMLSPYVSGKLFPIHSRITRLIPSEPRMWTLTLYCGWLPGLCFLITLLRPRLSSPWLCLAILSLAFAFGQFGCYWLLYTFLPGYGQFRFPAKWLPLAALGITMHSAILLSTVKPQNMRSFTRFLTPVAVTLGLLLSISLIPGIDELVARSIAPYQAAAADYYWGPFSASGWISDVRHSLMQTFLLMLVAIFTCRLLRNERVTLSRFWTIILFVCIVDSILVARWQLATTALGVVSDSTATKRMSDSSRGSPPGQRFIVTQTEHPWPKQWKQIGSSQRLDEVYQAERQTWFSRWHLPADVAVLNNSLSIPSHRTVLFWAALNAHMRQRSPESQRQSLSLAGQYLAVDAIARRNEGELSFVEIRDPAPFARFHEHWTSVRPIRTHELPRETAKLITRVTGDDLSKLPMIETSSNVDVPTIGAMDKVDHYKPSVTELSRGPGLIELHASTSTAGIVQIMQMQDGNWQAQLIERSTNRTLYSSVYRCDIISQAVYVPAGEWRIRLSYEPSWWWPALILQAATTMFCVTFLGLVRK